MGGRDNGVWILYHWHCLVIVFGHMQVEDYM